MELLLYTFLEWDLWLKPSQPKQKLNVFNQEKWHAQENIQETLRRRWGRCFPALVFCGRFRIEHFMGRISALFGRVDRGWHGRSVVAVGRFVNPG
jgi:hypothetical protein